MIGPKPRPRFLMSHPISQLSRRFPWTNIRALLIPERRSGRKPGARVTNFVLAEFKVVARDHVNARDR